MLRDYQIDLKNRIYAAWCGGARNVMATLPTGGGKTTVFCSILQDMACPSLVIAHRQELVSQAALSLAREGVTHGVVAPTAVIRQIVALEMDTFGRSFYDPRARVRVGGVDTIVARGIDDASKRWAQSVECVVIDEGHHVLNSNKWATALEFFPRARGLFPTAHAIRADGKGLGRGADGLADALIVGPSCRELIDRGYLSDYRLICPPTDVDVSEVKVGDSGEFNQEQLRAAIHKSPTIVGDIARNYVKFAAGKLGLTFAVDLEAARDIMEAYRKLGVPAEIITAKTPIAVRGQLMRRFRARELLQLVSVDVLGEGTDVPAVEVVSLGRHTASFQLMSQQVGRSLRVSGCDQTGWDQISDDERKARIAGGSKSRAIIIDHVGNWQRHLPLFDMPREYSLERRERRKKKDPDAIPMRTCLADGCFQPYERYLRVCPYCGEPVPPPAGRGSPEMVDGDLFEMDEATLRKLRAEVAKVDAAVPNVAHGISPEAVIATYRRHDARQSVQQELRKAIALWAGWAKQQGLDDGEIMRKFYLTHKVDVLTAQSLGAQDAANLQTKIQAELTRANVVPA